MYNLTNEDAHTYIDLHKNTYDGIIYPGNYSEKVLSHEGEIVITDPLECVYCNKVFISRNKLFRHLGYCNVDIRPKKLKQMKITKYLISCSDYDADTEEENNILEKKITSITNAFKNLNSDNILKKFKYNSKCMKKKSVNRSKKLKLVELFNRIKIK